MSVGQFRYVRWLYRAVAASMPLFLLAWGLTVVTGTGPYPKALGAVVLLLGVLSAWRAFKCAEIVITPTEVRLTTFFRTHRTAWDHVIGVGIVRASSAAPIPWWVPVFQLDDGSAVTAEEIRFVRETSPRLRAAVQEAERRLGGIERTNQR